MTASEDKKHKQKRATIKIEVEPQAKVSVLSNAHEFFLSIVLMIEESENEKVRYRLIVAQITGGANRKEEQDGIDEKYIIIATKSYETLRGGRIAFGRMFKGFDRKVKPDWTHFYTPEPGWLNWLSRCHVHPDSTINPGKTIIWPINKIEEEDCTISLKSENSSKPS